MAECKDRDGIKSQPHWVSEDYNPEGGTRLAQMLYDTGLLFLVNQSILHHFGLALNVMVAKDGATVEGIGLNQTSDPHGIWFDEATIQKGRERLRASGILMGLHGKTR